MGASAVSAERRALIWIGIVVGGVLALWLVSEVLLPFVVGAAVAYFLDPATRRLENLGLPRIWATTAISAAFFAFVGLALVLLAPVLQSQFGLLAEALPDYVEQGRAVLERVFVDVRARLAPEDLARLRAAAGQHAGAALAWGRDFLVGLWAGGLALVNLLSLVFVTPLVTFYLLRDWPEITAKVDTWLPRQDGAAIRAVLADIDAALAGFVRGQALVCVVMGVLYAAALSIAGLDFGLLVGLAVGALTVVPIIGALIGAVLAIGFAALQFGDWGPILAVAAIFVTGQVVEGNFLSPKLVGDRVGLHPLWIVFALLAGGALAGFLGIVLAVPLAAAVGVLARHGIRRYLSSTFYAGSSGSGFSGPDGGKSE